MAMKIGKIFDNRVFNKWRKQKLNTLRLNLLQSKVARVAVLLYIQVNDDEGEDNRPKTMRESWLVAGRLAAMLFCSPQN